MSKIIPFPGGHQGGTNGDVSSTGTSADTPQAHDAGRWERPERRDEQRQARIVPLEGTGEKCRASAGWRLSASSLPDFGLTERQAYLLVNPQWAVENGVVHVSPELPVEQIAETPIVKRVVALLGSVQNNDPVFATEKRRDLPIALVAELLRGPYGSVEPQPTGRRPTERQVPLLHFERALTQRAGLLRYQKRRLTLTRVAQRALEAGDYSIIYRRLLETHLAGPQMLDRYDDLSDGKVVASSLPLALFSCRQDGERALYEEDLAEAVLRLFPRLFEVTSSKSGDVYHELCQTIRYRVLERFGVAFGLFERVERAETESLPVEPDTDASGGIDWNAIDRRSHAYRRTELFNSALGWSLPPPPRPFASSEAIAQEWTEQARVHLELVPADLQSAERACVRAIERRQDHAEAYVVWARIREHRPERALRIVEEGLREVGDRKPEVEPKESVWLDKEFRDVLRLHMKRAAILKQLDRMDEACVEWETLLRLDSYDTLGARHELVAAQVAQGRLHAARKTVDQFPHDRSIFSKWNAVLVSRAAGNLRRAATELDSALQRNPHVPRALRRRKLPPAPTEYGPGSADEAAAYREIAGFAWYGIPGAIGWVRERAQRVEAEHENSSK